MSSQYISIQEYDKLRTQNEELSKRIKELEEDGYRELWLKSQKENKELKQEQSVGLRLHKSLSEKLYAVGGNLENHKIMVKDLREKLNLIKEG